MKNPFLDTAKYTVVKEYNRIANRSRSHSNSSCSSQPSDSSYKIYDKRLHNDPSSLTSSRFQLEYIKHPKFLSESFQKMHDRQQRNARFFGLQEYRYKPAYFQEIKDSSNNVIDSNSSKTIDFGIDQKNRNVFQGFNNSEEHYLTISSPIEKTGQKNSKKVSQKSLKSIKRCSNELPVSANENQFSRTKSSFCGSQNFGSQKRRSSFLRTLVNLKDTVEKKNENYDSVDQLTSQRVISPANCRKLKKKPSFFMMAQKNQNKFSPLIKSSESSTFYIEQVSSLSSVAKNKKSRSRSKDFLPITYSGKSFKNTIFRPNSILVRGRLYHLFEKGD